MAIRECYGALAFERLVFTFTSTLSHLSEMGMFFAKHLTSLSRTAAVRVT